MDYFAAGFDYVRHRDQFFIPRTPATALRAVQLGLLPVSAYLYMVGNIKPLLEEPYDLQEIDRILAKAKIDLTTALLLTEIFEKLIQHPDNEVALLAAESINSLESRFNNRIFELQKKLEDPRSENRPATLRELVRLLSELGLLNKTRPVIKAFYLKEALELLKKNWKTIGPQLADVLQMIFILQELGWWKKAMHVVKVNWAKGRRENGLILARAETAYALGRIGQIPRLMARLDRKKLSSSEKALRRQWLKGWGKHV